jgi:hypothetical protein
MRNQRPHNQHYIGAEIPNNAIAPNHPAPMPRPAPVSDHSMADMRLQSFERITASRRAIELDQQNAFQFHIPRQVTVPAGSTIVSLPITIGADGDFLMEKVMISFTLSQSATDASGTAPNPYYKKPSLTLKVTDKGRGNLLTDSFVPVELIATPGIIDSTQVTPTSGTAYTLQNSNQLIYPFKWKYYFKATSTILIEILNLAPALPSTAPIPTANDCVLKIDLYGTKILRA